MADQVPRIVLASTSKYRKALLDKLNIAFEQYNPEYEEVAAAEESPAATSLRLAKDKAKSLLAHQPELSKQHCIIIGSDQVAHSTGRTLSKPGNFDRAFEQLSWCSGRRVTYTTGVYVWDTQQGLLAHFREDYHLTFRILTPATITRYLHLERPYDCAGAIKAEAHAITLIEETEGQDVNTLYGLPLIQLTSVLLGAGIEVPG